MKTTKNNSVSGFTLIEILAATSILVMLMLAATSMLMTTVMSQARGSIRAQVKDEGAAIMQRITYNLRNASEITSDCSGVDSTEINYKNSGSENINTIAQSVDNITLEDANGPIDLHTDAVTVKTNSFNITCTEDPGTGVKFITIDFTLTNKQEGEFNSAENSISETFSSSVQLRNYQAN